MKVRLGERVLAAIGLAVLSPVLVVVAALIRTTSPGPAIYRARRVGQDGRPFTLLKFRTMSIGADRVGSGITVPGDDRITRVGRMLRSTKIDELPQLVNVIRGEMAFVGPRPEDPRYVAEYTAVQRSLLQYPPGITSPASIRYRDEAACLAALQASGMDPVQAYQRILADKLLQDAQYMGSRSIFTDVQVVWATVTGRSYGRR